jgi:hypothetical protein
LQKLFGNTREVYSILGKYIINLINGKKDKHLQQAKNASPSTGKKGQSFAQRAKKTRKKSI